MSEQQSIVDAIHKLEMNLTNRMHTHTLSVELNNQRIETLSEKVDKQHDALFGTHYEDDPGLLAQMGELRKTERERKYTVRTVMASFLAIMSKFIYDLFQHS